MSKDLGQFLGNSSFPLKSREEDPISEEVYTSAIRENVTIPENPPQMVIIVGPCRSGTTALSHTFARAGFEADMQPIKSIRRAVEEKGLIVPWTITENVDLVISKETIGPKTDSEFFDPIEILLNLGYPPERLHLIPILREPHTTIDSWKRMWGEADPINLNRAYLTVAAVTLGAIDSGIAVTPYIHEAIQTNPPREVVGRLFDKISTNLVFVPEAVDWKEGPRFGDAGSKDVFFDSPPDKFIEGVRETPGYKFLERPSVESNMDGREIEVASQIYFRFKDMSERVLNLKI